VAGIARNRRSRWAEIHRKYSVNGKVFRESAEIEEESVARQKLKTREGKVVARQPTSPVRIEPCTQKPPGISVPIAGRRESGRGSRRKND
jgi:hypothetical protein